MTRAEDDFYGFPGQAQRTREMIAIRERIRASEAPRKRAPEEPRVKTEALGSAIKRRAVKTRKVRRG